MTGPVRIAYALDRGYLHPCAVSLHSVLSRCSGPVEIHLLSHGFDAADLALLDCTVASFPAARLHVHPLPQERLTAARFEHGYLTVAAFGRLFLPDLLAGKVLYLDPDTVALDDLRGLYEVDLGGAAAGAVRDLGVLEQQLVLESPAPVAEKVRARAARRLRNLPEGVAARDYFNSGVMLLDCEAIRGDARLIEGFRDFAAAAGMPYIDQDWLNLLLHGRVSYLDPRWNTDWGNRRSRRSILPRAIRQAYAASRRSPGILHFLGRRKPWQPFRLSHLHAGPGPYLAWRQAARQWRGSLPEAARALL